MVMLHVLLQLLCGLQIGRAWEQLGSIYGLATSRQLRLLACILSLQALSFLMT
jgi:hypothetical protein